VTPPAQVQPVNGSCVALENNGLLIIGASGAGKSTLAVEMIALGCRLVADDYTDLARRDDVLVARAPQNYEGLVEMRELGLVKVAHQSRAVLRYVVDLDATAAGRLPSIASTRLLGVELELIAGRGIHALASKLVLLLCGGRLPVAPS
jgi:HPr kinase/phosphorylase